MTTDLSAIARALRPVDPALVPVAAQALAGGVSARVTAVTVADAGGSDGTLVIRQYGQANLRADPLAASHELAVLRLLHAAGLPVPRPRYADDSSSVLGGPYLVTDFIDGQPVTDVDCGLAEELAGFLARLHGLGVTRSALPHLHDIRASADQRIRHPPAVPDETLSESAIRAALATAWPPPRDNGGILLHGDYWPGNTLWRNRRLAGVIDWEDAVLGDPVAELAGARMELWMLVGAAAATAFTDRYLALRPQTDVAGLPSWDLSAALRHAGRMHEWGLAPAELARIQAGHRDFVTAALARAVRR